MKPNPKVSIVISGQVRGISPLIACINQLETLRNSINIDKIILSTWNQDIINQPGILKISERLIVLDNGNEPEIKSPGYFLHQMRTLHGALNLIDDDSYIIKTRPDVILIQPSEWIPQIINRVSLSTTTKPIYNKKIWSPYFFPTIPFFIADQCFIGLAEDIRKSVNYNCIYQTNNIQLPRNAESTRHFAAPAPEILFWAHPFLQHYPILNEYLLALPSFRIGHKSYNNFHHLILRRTWFQEILALYLHLISEYFIISPGHFLITDKAIDESRFTIRFDSNASLPELSTGNRPNEKFGTELLLQPNILNRPIASNNNFGLHDFNIGMTPNNELYKLIEGKLQNAISYKFSATRYNSLINDILEISRAAPLNNNQPQQHPSHQPSI